MKIFKKIVLDFVLKTVIIGAILGTLTGIGVVFIAYAVCDLYQLPYLEQLQTSTNIETIVTLYIGGWGIAGIVAKLLPW